MSDARQRYEHWHEQLDVDSLSDTPWHRLVKSYLRPAHDLAGKRILEIGCGRGGFACWLGRRTPGPLEIVAADLSRAALRKGQAFAESKGIKLIDWHETDIQDIGFPDESFDTVISCETLEHVPDPRRALRELARVLRPNGRLYLTVPNYFGSMGAYRAYARLRGRPYTEEGQPINNCLLLPLVRLWVSGSGLRVRTVDAVGHYLPLPGRVPAEIAVLNRWRFFTRWFGLHSLIIADKAFSSVSKP